MHGYKNVPYGPYFEEIEVRQSYKRKNTCDTKVTCTAAVKYGDESDFEEANVKIIDIGPDPPLCAKRYIWGRKSKIS